jgi:CRP-like cAMP-binding protein
MDGAGRADYFGKSMTAAGSPFEDWLATKGELRRLDRAVVTGLGQRHSTLRRGDSITWDRERDEQYVLVTSGLMVVHDLLRSGHRPTLGLYTPGDLISSPRSSTSKNTAAIQSLTDAQIVTLPVRGLVALAGRCPDIAKILWHDSRRELAIAQAWLTNVGVRDARARLAHFLCEFAMRVGHDGSPGRYTFQLPLTQQDIGDMLGLTAIHVNRKLRALSIEGLIVRCGQTVTVDDWRALASIGDFEPGYLGRGQELRSGNLSSGRFTAAASNAPLLPV